MSEVSITYEFAPIGHAVTGLHARTVIVPFSHMDNWDTVTGQVRAEALSRGHAITNLRATSIHQTVSGSFELLSAQSDGWSKLPDWPEWSRQMASVPL